MSQSELARRVGINQSTIAALLAGRTRSSAYLHKIARVLETTPEYLSGETDDPHQGAPLPMPPAPLLVMLPVTLPNEDALARMFEAMLEVIDPRASLAEIARELAQTLPTGLSQLRGLLPDARARHARSASPEALPSADPVQP